MSSIFSRNLEDPPHKSPRENLMTALVSAYEAKKPLTGTNCRTSAPIDFGGYETVPSALHQWRIGNSLASSPRVTARSAPLARWLRGNSSTKALRFRKPGSWL